MEQSLTRTRGNVPRPRAALYIQVSTKEDQGSDHRRQLQRFCECQVWAIVAATTHSVSVSRALLLAWSLIVLWAGLPLASGLSSDLETAAPVPG